MGTKFFLKFKQRFQSIRILYDLFKTCIRNNYVYRNKIFEIILERRKKNRN